MRSSHAPPVPDVRGSLTLPETAMTLAGCIRELTSHKTGIYKDREMLRLPPTYLWLRALVMVFVLDARNRILKETKLLVSAV